MPKGPPQLSQRLAHLEYLGDASEFASRIHALIPRCSLLENFSPAEIRLLTQFMHIYRAGVGAELIREGEPGDFMLMILEGKVEVRKRDREGKTQVVAVVDAGKTLGEMSMIDGEARFATCVAIEPAMLAILDRENLARIIVEQPMLGAKILMELVLILSQRLRTTSERLLGLLDEQPQGAETVS
jgi:CRP/FNR family cyclic AMP-dependent transcriptional regulator